MIDNSKNFRNGNNNCGVKAWSEEREKNTLKLKFNDKDEITDANESANYVDIAKEVIVKKLKRDPKNGKLMLTTSQIRNIMNLLAEIYKIVLTNENKELSDSIKSKIQYFRMKSIYQAGREPLVKDFVDKSGLLEIINQIGDKKERFKNYYHYMESLVAWHRYDGGKDQ